VKILELVNKDEVTVCPFDSIISIEDKLVGNAYLVVKDGTKFIGILTPSDVLVSGHNLVIDCYTEKPRVNGNEETEDIMNMMLMKGLLVVPVVDDDDEYMGSLQITSMLRRIWDIVKPNVIVNWINVIGDDSIERRKKEFSSELFHNTRNPVQVILSAVDMLRSATRDFDNKLLLSTIESNAKLLEELITKLYSSTFDRSQSLFPDEAGTES
jgi:CBS domain-containing protein